MNSEPYMIPANFTEAGRIMGLFEIRNTVEAVVLTVPLLYFCMAMLSLALTAKIIVTLTLTVPVGGFALTGIGGDSLTQWLWSWYRWRKSRRLLYHR